MRVRSIVTAVSVVALLAACAQADEPEQEEPGGAGESSAAADGEEAEALPPGLDLPEGWRYVEGVDIPSVTAEPRLPVEVVDATGAEVTVDDASRIIIGGDDIAEILDGLGLADLLYAAPSGATSPVAATAPEQFELSQATGAEGLLSMDGTLFIGNNPARHGEAAEQFRAAGVPAVVVDDQQSTGDKIRAVAEYLGDAEAGEELASRVDAQFAEAADLAEGLEDLRILQVTSRGAGGNNSVVGTGTAGADIVEALGAVSVGVESGLRGYSTQYSNEGLLAAEPDVILMGTADLEDWGGLEGFVQAFPTLIDTPAGQAGRIVVMPTEQVKVSGPSSGAGALALAEALLEFQE